MLIWSDLRYVWKTYPLLEFLIVWIDRAIQSNQHLIFSTIQIKCCSNCSFSHLFTDESQLPFMSIYNKKISKVFPERNHYHLI